jgi:5-methylcytosine-specific restriction endonuclease McrA
MIVNNGKISTIINPSSAGNTLGYGQPNWSRLTVSILSLDPDKYCLGKICLRGHEYKQTGKSLRYQKKRTCVVCAKEKSKRQRLKDHDKYLEYLKKYRLENLDFIKQKQKIYREANWEEIRRKKLEAQKKNREQANKRNRKYQATKRGKIVKARASRLRYSREKNVHFSEYTPEQVTALKAKFDGCCAYCGKVTSTELDHFIPIARGGSDCLGNYIPICRQCNSSKSGSDPMKWYKKQPFYSAERWQKILKVLGKTESNYNQLPLF